MANKKNPLKVTPVYNRGIARRILKNQVGSNRIAESWRNIQIKRYGASAMSHIEKRKDDNKDAKKFDSIALLKFVRSFLGRKRAV